MRQKYVSLLRVSTKRQGRSGIGLKAQRIPINEYINQHNGTLLREFKEVESGNKKNKKRKRSVLKEALALCRKHNAILLVATPNRLTRNSTLGCALLEGDVHIICVDRPHASKFELRLMFIMAELEWDNIQANAVKTVKVKRQQNAKLGTNGEKLSLYYKKKRDAFDHKLSPIIRELRAEGLSMRDIAQELARRRFKKFQGSRNWTHSVILGIMRRNGIR